MLRMMKSTLPIALLLDESMREKGVQIDEFPSPGLLRDLSRSWWRVKGQPPLHWCALPYELGYQIHSVVCRHTIAVGGILLRNAVKQ